MPQPLSIEQVKKIPPKVLLKLIQRAKDFLKTNKIFLDMCKKYDSDPSFIDNVPVKFGDLDVSARTERGVITLAFKLLCDGDFFKDYSYLCHESEHYLQQTCGDKPTIGADDMDYLKNPYEQEAFATQIEYIKYMFGKEEADKYLDHLLDHHDKDGKDRKKIKDKLEAK